MLKYNNEINTNNKFVCDNGVFRDRGLLLFADAGDDGVALERAGRSERVYVKILGIVSNAYICFGNIFAVSCYSKD
jgi:hypothetical protein